LRNVIIAQYEATHRDTDAFESLAVLRIKQRSFFRDYVGINIEDNPDDIPDLVAEILSRQVERRLRRNLSFGYRSREAVLGRVRGRINLLYTERHQLLDRGKVDCRFNELTVDTVRNRFVRTALEEISKIVGRKKLAHRCRSLAASLKYMGVTGERPSRTEISIDQFGGHDLGDQQMVSAAHLAFNLALPTEAAGTTHLSMPDREINWIRKLYERGIAGFYDVVLSGQGL
jgi:5-methylcytosine-specific restriction enzyme subunit McrC